ncbi:MAG: transglycosylase [Clostridiales bacterium]|nr:transglycosylase [Clostridiales bacterium]
MRKEEVTIIDLLLEAVGIVSGLVYMGLQIYYSMIYGVNPVTIVMNGAVLILVYIGLTLLSVYPEKVNGLTREACSGLVRKYTIHMVRLVKLIFVLGLLFTSICDVLGHQLNSGYSMIVVILVVVTVVYYEGKIIHILRKKK